MWSYVRSSVIWSVLGLILAAYVGWYYEGTVAGAGAALFICFLLALLEISISFDNAIVNATVLKDMTEKWRHRFLTWGILVAVFGMRLIFPLAIVSIATGIGPIDALTMAARQPDEYKRIMLDVHHQVAAFGGVFLLLVAFRYFFDEEKTVHWFGSIERSFVILSRIKAIEIGAAIAVLMIIAQFLDSAKQFQFLEAGLLGVLTFLCVEGISEFLKIPQTTGVDPHRASIGMFLYLEVLDASFSFDGVVGAFALTTNIFLIAIGLGIGAFFVRSLTILLVERETLQQYKYLEHGAFYAMAALALTMFVGTIVHIPELITGIVGAAIIGFSIFSSIREKPA